MHTFLFGYSLWAAVGEIQRVWIHVEALVHVVWPLGSSGRLNVHVRDSLGARARWWSVFPAGSAMFRPKRPGPSVVTRRHTNRTSSAACVESVPGRIYTILSNIAFRCLTHCEIILHTMAPAPKIKLYVDTVSPFAYIAYHVLRVSHDESSQRDEEGRG